MVLFHFRVHIDNLIIDNLILFIKSHSMLLLMVKEIGDRPHVHCILEPTKTVSTFRQQFLKTFPQCKGNKCYSLEEAKDIDKLKCYLSKGESETIMPVILFNKDVDVDCYHKQYWETNKSLKSHTASQQKVKTLTWTQEVKSEFQEQYPQDVLELSDPIDCRWKPTEQDVKNHITSKKLLLSFVLKKLGKSVKVLDDNIITRLYKGVLNSFIQEGSHTGKYTDFLFDKLGL